MATLVGNAKYGEGHEVILKDKGKLSAVVENKFREKGYLAGEARFAITLDKKAPSIIVDLGTGKEKIVVKDAKGKLVQIIGSASSINGSFNHFTANAKSDTKLLTEVKETISMVIFEAFFEKKKTLSEDEVMKALPKPYADKFDSTYYESAIKQLAELKKYVKGSGYTYERQGQNKTAELYKQARALSGLANDNWNPADVWMIKKTFKGFDTKFKNINELNDVIATSFKSREVIPISLKNVTDAKAVSEVVESAGNQKVDLDLAFARIDLSDTFNNFIVQTKSGFAARVGFKASASTLNVSVEGRMIGAGYQMGAVDAKGYAQFCQDKYKYQLRSTGNVSKADIETAKKELKAIVAKYPRFSNTIKDYKQAIDLLSKGNDLTQKRFANLVSYMHSFLIAPKDFKQHMKFCYFSSKKISDKSSTYLLLK